MATKTFADLKSDVQKWLNRNDPEIINLIPNFVSLAEQEFSRSVKIPMDEGHYQEQVGLDETYITIPDDLLSPIAMYVNAQPYTRVNGYGYFKTLATNNQEGQYFCKFEDRFLFYPELTAGDIVVVTYHKELKPLEIDSDTNAALEYGYDLMLYWTLKHASMFLRDPDNEQYWTKKAQEALVTMEQTFDEFHWKGSPLRVLGVGKKEVTNNSNTSTNYSRSSVVSVNGKTGSVVLSASDVNAYSKAESDGKYAPAGAVGAVDSINGQTGTVVLTASDVGAITRADADGRYALYGSTVESINNLRGRDITLTARDVGAAISKTSSESDFDSYDLSNATGFIGLTTNTMTNGPSGVVDFRGDVLQVMSPDFSHSTQVLYRHNENKIYTRTQVSGAWGAWAEIGAASGGGGTGGAVTSVNSLTGDVILGASQVGAYSKAEIDTQLGALVPKTFTVAGHPLSGNISISASDVGTYSSSEIDTKIAAAGTFDPTSYYTKTQANAQFVDVAGDTMTGQLEINYAPALNSQKAMLRQAGNGDRTAAATLRYLTNSPNANWTWETILNGTIGYTIGNDASNSSNIKLVVDQSAVQANHFRNLDGTEVYAPWNKPSAADLNIYSKSEVDAKVAAGSTPANMMTTDTTQTISGVKTFTAEGITFSGTVDMQNCGWVIIPSPVYPNSPVPKSYVDNFIGKDIASGTDLNSVIEPGFKFISSANALTGMNLPTAAVGENCALMVCRSDTNNVVQKLWITTKSDGTAADVGEYIRCKFNTWSNWMKSALTQAQ